MFKIKNENVRVVIEELQNAGFDAKIAGGAVRDLLLDHKPNDYDIATTATPEQVLEVFKDYKTIPTGLEHGTVTVNLNFENIEITTLRIDKSCDGRHAEVEFTDSFKEDAARRDFTINAMFMDLDGMVHDFFNGQADLKSNTLKFVGNPEDRIQEDYLRIMRYYRFIARFDLLADKEAEAAIIKHKEGLKKISQERITSELMKMFSYTTYRRSVALMSKHGVLDLVLPEAKSKPKFSELQDSHFGRGLLSNYSYSIFRLAGVLWGMKEDVEKVGGRLKLSNLQTKQLKSLLQVPNIKESADVLELFEEVLDGSHQHDHEYQHFLTFWQKMDVSYATIMRMKAVMTADSHRIRDFPIKGDDLLMLGMSSGPQIGTILKGLKRNYYNQEFNSREQGLAIIMKYCQDKKYLANCLIHPDERVRKAAENRAKEL